MFTLFVNILKTNASRREMGENVAHKKEFMLEIFWP
jgi:hypothetical protein